MSLLNGWLLGDRLPGHLAAALAGLLVVESVVVTLATAVVEHLARVRLFVIEPLQVVTVARTNS